MKERTGPIARPGYRFIFTGLIIFLLGFWAGRLFSLLGLVLTLFFLYFFRDPERAVPAAPGQVISPADGRIIVLERVREETFPERTCSKAEYFYECV